MIAKALEVRDRLTFVPVLAVKMISERKPSGLLEALDIDAYEPIRLAQEWLLRRCGYPIEQPHAVLLTKLAGGERSTADPYEWNDRTFQAAHLWIVDNFDVLADGDVIDVEHILGESVEKKLSERFTT